MKIKLGAKMPTRAHEPAFTAPAQFDDVTDKDDLPF